MNVFIVYNNRTLNYSDPNFLGEIKSKIEELIDHLLDKNLLIIISKGFELALRKLTSDYRVNVNNFDQLYDVVLDTMIIETKEGLEFKDRKTAEDSLKYTKNNGILFRLITKYDYEKLPYIKIIKPLELSNDINVAIIQTLIYYGPKYFVMPENMEITQEQLAIDKLYSTYKDIVGENDVITLANLYNQAIEQLNLQKWCRNMNINYEQILKVFSITGQQRVTVNGKKIRKLGIKLKRFNDLIYVDENFVRYKLDLFSMPRLLYLKPDIIYALKIVKHTITIYTFK